MGSFEKGRFTMKNLIGKIAISLCLCGVLGLSLTACGDNNQEEKDGQSAKASVSSSALNSQAQQSSSTASVNPKLDTASGPQEVKIQVFVQENSNAEEGYEPTIRLMENNSFEFMVFLYDGTALVSGSYEEGDGAYTLHCENSNMPGVSPEDLGDIELTVTDTGVTYHGSTAGVTFDGASFAKQ